MESPSPSVSSKSRQRRTRKDAQLRKALISDYGSVHSAGSVLGDRKSEPVSNIRKPTIRTSQSDVGKRTVLGLRPGKAMTIPCSISVQEAARKMGSVRADAALVTLNGEVCGIITDSDITRRVVAAGKKASSTPVSLVMTGNPLSMKPSDQAFDALQIMVDRHFRHLPVMRTKSSIVGLLDINRCLSDAIKRNEDSDFLKSGQGCLSGLKFTLEQVIERNEEEAPFVYDKDPVIDAAKVMAKSRKTAVLVKDFKRNVVGILTTKDIMLRVVAARLMPHSTTVARVMTPHPDTALSSLTVGDALKKMRSKRYLHLPVACDEEGKDVIGLVDALELCYIVLKPEKSDKENQGENNDLRGVLEGLWQGGDSYASDSESVAGSVTEDSRLHTPQRSRAGSVAAAPASAGPLFRRGSSITTGNGDKVASTVDADGVSIRSIGRESKKPDGAESSSVLAHVEGCIFGLEKAIQANSKESQQAIESTMNLNMGKQTEEIHMKIQKEVGEVKRMIQAAKWAAGGEEIKLKVLQGEEGVLAKLEALPEMVEKSLKDLLNNIASKMEKIETAVKKQDMHSATQLEVIRNLTAASVSMPKGSHTAAAPMTIQPLLEILSKSRSELQEQSSTIRNDVKGSMTKIESMISETNTTLTKLASASAAMPDIVKTAVARASRPSFSEKSGGYSTRPAASHQPGDLKVEVADTCNRIAFQTVEIVRSKLSTAFEGARFQSKELTSSNQRLSQTVEKMNESLLRKLETSVDGRVHAKVESELVKVAGASAIAGILLGMLSIKLFGSKA
eukprot:CAMPEP_0184483646 /NCGR_PEP_ID=MMETSP0113_2-20130426/5327_1 /TAXON_ID=91329 /ORGANISM="Norrisiella sphaerica, Strain BC52" /LENGTH=789 /DNA_ID=CAMNT_0026864195 /DNA_START=60 /DNA_END=2429 /DNA_ORIENTATION=-